jgi:hypothetical protein
MLWIAIGIFAALLVGATIMVFAFSENGEWYVYSKETTTCIISPYSPSDYAHMISASYNVTPSVIDQNKSGIHTIVILNPSDHISVVFTNSRDFCEFTGKAIRAGER